MRRKSAAFIALLGLAACDTRTTVIATVDRSDGQGFATVEEARGNATVSTIYIVMITGKGGSDTTEVLKMDKGAAPTIAWRPDGALLINAPCGQIYNFKNFAIRRDSQDGQKISVILTNSGLCPQS